MAEKTFGERFENVLKFLISVQGLENTFCSIRTILDDEGKDMRVKDLLRALEDELSYCIDSAAFGS